jgi:hypothetical protein
MGAATNCGKKPTIKAIIITVKRIRTARDRLRTIAGVSFLN